jgi:hypothetical protein
MKHRDTEGTERSRGERSRGEGRRGEQRGREGKGGEGREGRGGEHRGGQGHSFGGLWCAGKPLCSCASNGTSQPKYSLAM